MAVELSIAKDDLDPIDCRLVARLMRQGRATWADLAVELGLTAPAIAQRVRRLEERGVIRQFAAWVAPEAIAPVCAFVSVHFAGSDQHEGFRAAVLALDAVQECHRIAGADDYLLKVRCRSLAELEALERSTLSCISGVARTHTTVVLSTIKDTPVLPIPGIDGAAGG